MQSMGKGKRYDSMLTGTPCNNAEYLYVSVRPMMCAEGGFGEVQGRQVGTDTLKTSRFYTENLTNPLNRINT